MTTALDRTRALLNTPPPPPVPGQLDLTQEETVEIVYLNRRPEEARTHIELDAHEVAALARQDSAKEAELRNLIATADHRLNPTRQQLA